MTARALVERVNTSTVPTFKLVLVFAVAFSLASLPGPLSTHQLLPGVQLAKANTLPSTELWYPSGPAMDTEIVKIYQDQISEFFDLQNRAIDLSDWRLDAGTSAAICSSPSFFCTSHVQERSYVEIEFNLANNFWGINMGFGNDPNGLQLRQGIAHLVDKNSFSINEPSGPYTPIDNPLPPGQSFGGTAVTYPNPCLWDQNNTETGANCTTTTTGVGGIAYHLAAATGSNCGTEAAQTTCTYPWQPGFRSLDFCAAADHFITAFRHSLGIIVTKDANCVLLAPGQTTPGVGWPTAVTNNKIQFYVRLDDPPRYDLGKSMTQELCALFTGAFTTGTGLCVSFIFQSSGPITPFCGYFTSTTIETNCWWMYTAASGNVFPFDTSLYYYYNSRFVSGVPADKPPCTTNALPSPAAGDYMYLCSPAYDTASQGIEFPAGNSLANSFTAATSAMDLFGQNAFTIPIYTPSDTYGYLSNWSRVINGDGVGIPNRFTWLNAWTNTPSTGTSGCPPSTPLCVRQGFEQPTPGIVTPYAITTVPETYVVNNVYDTLSTSDPANAGQIFDWMTINTQELSNTQLNYIPPGCTSQTVCSVGGTVDTFRFTLRNDIFWQDNRKVTSWDVQFSYATGFTNGAFSYSGTAPMVCTTSGNCADGITVLSPSQFDVHVFDRGPFTRIGISTNWIIPGRYWSASCAGNRWDGDVASGSVPASCMTTNLANSNTDPIASGIFIGSGAWKCGTITVGGGCTSTGTQSPLPGGTYTLTRFGIGHAPGSSVTDSYFRSNGALALDIWSGNTGDPTWDSINFSRIAACFGAPVGTPSCTHWQRGIGNPGPGTVIGGIQTSIVLRFVFVNWVSPFDSARSPPQGMVAFPPATLHEGSFTFNNCVADPVNGYDC